MTSVSQFLDRNAENNYLDGVPVDDDATLLAEEAHGEIERRRERCGNGGYPCG